jgi:hypothetical protein
MLYKKHYKYLIVVIKSVIFTLDVIQQPADFGRKDISRLQLPMLRHHLLITIGTCDVSVDNLSEV